MKTNILAIAFALAASTLTFAAQTPAKPAAPAKTANSTVKKSKHSKKAVKDTSKPASTGGNASK